MPVGPVQNACELRGTLTMRSRTVGALPGDDEVDAVGDEAVMFAQMEPDLTHELPGVVPDGAAGTADEMGFVVRMGDLPSGRLVDAEKGTTHQVEFLEDGEGTINRGSIDRGVGVVHLFGDLIGREVPGGRTQHRPDEPARAGEAIAVFPEDSADIGGGGHEISVGVQFHECDKSAVATHLQ